MSTAVEAMQSALRELSLKKKRVPLSSLWKAFQKSCPSQFSSDDARPLLAKLVEQMAENGFLRTPKGQKYWQHRPAPPLPSWVEISSVKRSPSVSAHKEVAWPPCLAFVSDLPKVSNLEELLIIKRFLAQGGADRPLLPTRERSLELFRDEKRLDILSKASLFGPGRLSLSDLRCREVQLPLVWEPGHIKAKRGLLILENLHTYDSFRRFNESARLYRGIAYGAGNSFRNTVRDLPRILALLESKEALYFGDLDKAGVEIACGAARLLTQCGAGLTLRPDIACYTELLDCALSAKLPGPIEVPPERTDSWFGEPLAARVRTLMGYGWRGPQELVGWEYLRLQLLTDSSF